VGLPGLEKLAQFPKARQFHLVRCNPDMAHDALADLAFDSDALDQLHGLARAVGRGFYANEHGRSILPRAGKVN